MAQQPASTQQNPPASTVPTPSPAAPPAATSLPQQPQSVPVPQQQPEQPSPSPALPPNMNLPALSPVPTQRTIPEGPNAQQAPNAQMEQPPISPLTQHVDTPEAPAPQVTGAMNSKTRPEREETHGITPNFLGFLGPFRQPAVPPLFDGSETRLQSLIRDGKLYLTLQDAISLALENNLDVETERYDLVLARADEVRAKGGGNLRGIDYSVAEPPNGVGGPGSPLLAAETTNTNPVSPTVTDLTSLNSTAQTTLSLSQLGTGFQYAPGPDIPIFDPQLLGVAGWLRRSDTVNLTSATGTTGTTGTAASTAPLDFTALNLGYIQGFSTGAQLEAIVNNDSEVLYGASSKYDPFYSPSTSLTLIQPLLRGRGRNVNLRYIRIARTNQKISRLLFEQQVLDTIYGVSRLYFDLVSLGENVLVQQESLRAATKLREDDQSQVDLGTLAPIELTRAQALESSSRFSLIQAQGLYKQEEIILKNQLLRTASPVFTAQFDEIIPTDRIIVPDQPEPIDVPALIREGLAQRPDLAQAKLQVEAGKINVEASRNGVLPQLNLYGNVEVRGTTEQPFEIIGSTGTGQPSVPSELAAGGLRTSTIYQAGVELMLPLRNRVAASDAARDTVELRQVEGRTEKLSQQIREEIETAVVALQTAQAAYVAATASRQYQSQLLDAERDKLSVGQSTDLAVLQDEAYLAQARSTEIAARSNWKKAQIELDHDLGDLLEKNHIVLDDAIRGTLPQ
ncbi:MAG TPA: TolC family protein [Acidobacteriaceae bacterium]|nr:TolC family protein [Acidobacteriaceae bacterium]